MLVLWKLREAPILTRTGIIGKENLKAVFGREEDGETYFDCGSIKKKANLVVVENLGK